MTDETVDCWNCGRANPDWAQVCRSCGVPLRRGDGHAAIAGRFPTDRDSLVSIGAVIGTILVALVLGLFISNLNPTDPTVGVDPSPTATATPELTEEPTFEPSAPVSAPPSVAATPALTGTVVFGTTLDGNRQVTDPTDTFTPGMTFAHTVTNAEPFGVATVGEQVVRILEDGTEEVVVSHTGDNPNQLSVNPEATTAGFVGPDAAAFIQDWGPGVYEMRIYTGETLIARGQFRLAEG